MTPRQAPIAGKAIRLATIGYERAMVDRFLEALRGEGVELLVDVRAVASSRRPGFSKSRLRENLAGAGIDYLHLRGLGTPAEGRAAARAGRHAEMREIYLRHLATPEARDELATLAEIVRSGRRVCLLCFEADAERCHRRIVSEELVEKLPLEVVDLMPEEDG